jgi:hypothetical protein
LNAQELAPRLGEQVAERRVFASAGYDSTWVVDLGGAQHLLRPTPRTSLTLCAALRVPVVLVSELDSFGAIVAPRFGFVADNGLGVAASLGQGVRTASDATGDKVALRLNSVVEPGYHARGWSVLLRFAMVTTYAVHLRHSEAVKDLFNDRYPDETASSGGPRDGWYGLTGHEVRTGVAGAVGLNRWFALYGVGGWRWRRHLGVVGENPPISALPFFVQLGGEVSYDFAAGLDHFPRQVLFVAGTCSALGPDFQRRHNMPLFQHAEMAVINEAGHRLFIERFDTVLAAVRPYLHAYSTP